MATSLGWGIAVLGAGLEKNTALLGAVRGWRREAAGNGGEAPFLDVGLDEDESRLAQVDVHSSRAVGADSREEVLRLEPVDDFLELLAVASKEDGTGPGSVSNADDVALDEAGAVRSVAKGLVVVARSVGVVCNRVFMIT